MSKKLTKCGMGTIVTIGFKNYWFERIMKMLL